MKILNNTLVLIVDDNAEIVSLMSRLVKGIGYSAISANSGQSAVETVYEQQARIWCAIIDIHLPDADGIVVGRQMRQILPGLPIIFITGYPLFSLRDHINQFDTAFLIGKPFDINVLREALQHFATSNV